MKTNQKELVFGRPPLDSALCRLYPLTMPGWMSGQMDTGTVRGRVRF